MAANSSGHDSDGGLAAHITHTPSMISRSVSLLNDPHAPGVGTPLLENTPLLHDGAGALYDGNDINAKPRKQENTTYAKVKYYIPGLAWIPNYSLSLLGGDVLAGLTVACMLIPQSVSYASSLAGLSPVAGLFSASVPGIFYALLGSSRQLNVAPEASLSLLVGQAVNDVLHSYPGGHPGPEKAEHIGLSVATMITLQAGVFSFLLGFFRLGFIDVVLSRALLQGFIAAVALVIMVEQLTPMFGLTALSKQLHPHTTFDKLLFLIEHVWTHAHRTTTLISFVALAVLIIMRSSKKAFKAYWFIYRLPEVLVVVIGATVLSKELRWDKDGIDILGSVPINTGSSLIELPLNQSNLKFLTRTTSTAILVSIIGFLDSIVAAKQNGARFAHSISPNRELVALGAANLVGSFIPGTLPAYGSITRSRINGDVGGRTQMASIVCSSIILLAIFVLLPYLYFLPKCVLASVICLVAFSLLAEAPHDVLFYYRLSAKTEMLLMLTTFVLSIVWDLEIGIVVSIIISLVLVVRRSSKPRMTILGRIRGTDQWEPINENPEAEEDVPGVLIVRIRENLDFANTAQLKERLRKLELYGVDPSHPSEAPRREQASVLVFHMADVDSCDASAVQIFYELLETYATRDTQVFITHLRAGPRAVFELAGIMRLLPPGAVQENVSAAMARIGGGSGGDDA